MRTIMVAVSRLVVIAALGMTMACGGNTNQATDPVMIGNLAARVEIASPQEADRILSDAGFDEASFRKAIEEIMEDPDRVVKFTQAYNLAKK